MSEVQHLKRKLGLGQAVALGVGGTLGGGIFVLVGSADGQAGPRVLLAFVIALGAALCIRCHTLSWSRVFHEQAEPAWPRVGPSARDGAISTAGSRHRDFRRQSVWSAAGAWRIGLDPAGTRSSDGATYREALSHMGDGGTYRLSDGLVDREPGSIQLGFRKGGLAKRSARRSLGLFIGASKAGRAGDHG